MENLTAEIEGASRALFEKNSQRMGEASAAKEKGFFQDEIRQLTHTFSRKKSIDMNV